MSKEQMVTVWTYRIKNFELEELLFVHVRKDTYADFQDLVKMPGQFFSVVTRQHVRFSLSYTTDKVGQAKIDTNGSGRCYIQGDPKNAVVLDDGSVLDLPPWHVEFFQMWDTWELIEDTNPAIYRWMYGEYDEEE